MFSCHLNRLVDVMTENLEGTRTHIFTLGIIHFMHVSIHAESINNRTVVINNVTSSSPAESVSGDQARLTVFGLARIWEPTRLTAGIRLSHSRPSYKQHLLPFWLAFPTSALVVFRSPSFY